MTINFTYDMTPEVAQSFALRMASGGARVRLYHWLAGNGRCSCGLIPCSTPGAHPITEKDEERWERWGTPQGKTGPTRVFVENANLLRVADL